MSRDLLPGSVWWVDLGERRGREQRGQRPAVVVSSTDALQILERLIAIIPCTTTDRGWPNHVLLVGELRLARPTFGMTEQVTTIDRGALIRSAGQVAPACQDTIRTWMHDWLI